MTTKKIYQLPVEITDWKFDGATEIHFNWEYDDGSSDLLNLYEKGKQQQWDTSTRLDWSQDLFEENPMGMVDESIPIYGSPVWEKMTEKERNWLRFNLQCHSICQFMHGEQGALIATAKIVNTVPDMNAKFYAATQVMDEARHVETYKRLIHETEVWRHMTHKERAWLRRNLQANTISQFMHGEQGALIATAKIVGTVPDMNAKFYAATQVMDEARHVEAYKRLLHEKFQLAYPINKALKALLEQTLTDRRWDMTYLGMQVLIEGLALAAFQSIRDKSGNTLAGAVNAYVMQDEARHVSFGRLALRDYYPQLSDAERDEREEFVVEALLFMRDRFNQSEVWERLGLPAKVLDDIHYNSKQMNSFRGRLFSRVVPTVKDIGLWGARVQKAFAEMGVMDYAKVDVSEQLANDGRVADDFDRKMFVERAVAAE
jgi:ribonucleotide reductase beta subunit family protein with ferritin-like domain